MKSPSPASFLAAVLLLLPAGAALASVDSYLDLQVKAYYQKESSISNDRERGRVGTVRIDSKQLLRLAEQELNTRFPDGAQLKVATDGKVIVTDSGGRTVLDISNLIEAKSDSSKALFNGEYFPLTGKENTRNYFPIKLKLKFRELTGSVRGIVFERVSAPSPDSDGIQIVHGRSDTTLSGKGTIYGRRAYYEGTMKLDGREVSIVR